MPTKAHSQPGSATDRGTDVPRRTSRADGVSRCIACLRLDGPVGSDADDRDLPAGPTRLISQVSGWSGASMVDPTGTYSNNRTPLTCCNARGSGSAEPGVYRMKSTVCRVRLEGRDRSGPRHGRYRDPEPEFLRCEGLYCAR
jgi:hypothetical protein